jgi:hypothetical protein
MGEHEGAGGEKDAYRPHHCPTCKCEPVGPLPAGMEADPYCPEHGSRPTAYGDCSCFARALPPAAGRNDSEADL